MANGLVDYRLIDPNMPAKAGTSWMQGFQQAQQDTAQEIQNRSAMQQYQNALAEAEAYKAAGGDYNKLQQELMSRGQGKAALGVAKQVSEIEKAGLETRLKKVELNRETFSNLRFNPSDENVLAHLQDQILRKDITPQQAEGMYAHILGMDPKQRVIYFTEMGAKADTAYKELKLQGRHEDEMGIKRGQLGVAQGQLALGQQRLAAEYDPTLIAQKAGATEIGKRQAIAQLELPAAIATGEEGIRKINELVGEKPIYKDGKLVNADKIKPHAGFETAVGATMFPGGRFVPGTSAADFQVRLDEIKGSAFMQAFNNLKGGGSITEKEGEKATSAITRMSTAQSEKEFITAAREFQDVLSAGIKRAKIKAGGAKTGGKTGVVVDFNDL